MPGRLLRIAPKAFGAATIRGHLRDLHDWLEFVGEPADGSAVPTIVLATLNAKFIHAAFGLRYLLANMGGLRDATQLLEFDIKQRPIDVAEAILALNPRIVGLGVYIWNATPVTELVAVLKRVRPGLTVILGGPEVSYDHADQPIVEMADYVITGEADFKFAAVCRDLLEGRPPAAKIIPAELPDVAQLALPYELYTDADLAHRIVYIEASRGCPFSCEFCLSSLDIPVRQFPLEPMLAELRRLMQRGLRHFKFVDRTFNLNLATSRTILGFFLENLLPGMFVHFEMVPDRLPEELREIIARFPAGTLQFEVGIQTFNPDVATRISRRQNYERLDDNLRYLREHTGVHLHADLIVGLPGETMDGFAEGFDRLVALGPQEIQVGILKRLRGAPIARHDTESGMVYARHPPYEILCNDLIDFAAMQRLRRFARYWDLIGNSGNFLQVTPMLWRNGSPFRSFLEFSDALYERIRRTDSISLATLAAELFRWLVEIHKHDAVTVAKRMLDDYQKAGRTEVPEFLRPYLDATPRASARRSGTLPKRQSRYLKGEQ
jgi:radical SAM superfamily enzyme YgiQ (UPF0313 family)